MRGPVMHLQPTPGPLGRCTTGARAYPGEAAAAREPQRAAGGRLGRAPRLASGAASVAAQGLGPGQLAAGGSPGAQAAGSRGLLLQVRGGTAQGGLGGLLEAWAVIHPGGDALLGPGGLLRGALASGGGGGVWGGFQLVQRQGWHLALGEAALGRVEPRQQRRGADGCLHAVLGTLAGHLHPAHQGRGRGLLRRRWGAGAA